MIYDFTKNNVCISGVNGDFGPLASYNPSALWASFTYRCPKNGLLIVHYGVEEITVNVRKMLKKVY
jgi:hypothetical protein